MLCEKNSGLLIVKFDMECIRVSSLSRARRPDIPSSKARLACDREEKGTFDDGVRVVVCGIVASSLEEERFESGSLGGEAH